VTQFAVSVASVTALPSKVAVIVETLPAPGSVITALPTKVIGSLQGRAVIDEGVGRKRGLGKRHRKAPA